MARQITLNELAPLDMGDLGTGRAVCISDIHYLEEENESDANFLRFLEELDTEYLFLVGDIFDFWLGDKHSRVPTYARLTSALKGCAARGIRIISLRGNRDFLAMDFFRYRIGAEVAKNAVTFSTNGTRVLLTHGDTVCTWDIRYAAWRRVCSSQVFAGIVTALPFRIGRFLGRLARAGSRLEARFKPLCSIEVFHNALGAVYREGVDVVAAGHIHNAGERTRKLNGREKRLFILGGWQEQGRYLEIAGGTFELKKWKES